MEEKGKQCSGKIVLQSVWLILVTDVAHGGIPDSAGPVLSLLILTSVLHIHSPHKLIHNSKMKKLLQILYRSCVAAQSIIHDCKFQN